MATPVYRLRRSKLILACAIAATLYAAYFGWLMLQPLLAPAYSGFFVYRTGMAAAWFIPHMIGVAAGVYLNWVGWWTKKRKYTLYAAILYAASALLLRGLFLGVLMLAGLAFIGFLRQDGLTAK